MSAACSFLSNLLATVFIMLNLNAIMSVIFNVPAAIFSTVSATFSRFLLRADLLTAIAFCRSWLAGPSAD